MPPAKAFARVCALGQAFLQFGRERSRITRQSSSWRGVIKRRHWCQLCVALESVHEGELMKKQCLKKQSPLTPVPESDPAPKPRASKASTWESYSPSRPNYEQASPFQWDAIDQILSSAGRAVNRLFKTLPALGLFEKHSDNLRSLLLDVSNMTGKQKNDLALKVSL